jgi:HD-like signal output (HDOD) protein
LHDIGKLIYCEYFPELFEKVWVRSVEEGLTFADAEKEVSLVGHAEVGAYIAEKWFLPKHLSDGVRYHHHPDTDYKIATIVRISDMIVNSWPVIGADRNSVQLGLENVPDFLKPALETLHQWYPQLQGEIESAGRFFIGESN